MRGVFAPSIPKDQRAIGDPKREAFGVDSAWNWDVFPEDTTRWEKEVLVVYAHAFSRRCIRVYNLAGDLLYQVWHDGAIKSWRWLAAHRLLVFAADTDTIPWNECGFAEMEGLKAQIVFAIRPKFGFESTEYITPMADGGPLKPAWYKIVWPPDVLSRYGAVNVEAPLPPHDPNETVAVVIRMAHKNQGHVTLILDASGNEINEPRIRDDAYRAHQEELPDYKTIVLRDFAFVLNEGRD